MSHAPPHLSTLHNSAFALIDDNCDLCRQQKSLRSLSLFYSSSSKHICVAPKAAENTSRWLSRNASSKKPNALWRNRAPLHPDAPSHIDPVHITDILPAVEFPESAPCLTKITCGTLMSRSTVPHRHHTKVYSGFLKDGASGRIRTDESIRRHFQARALSPR